MPPDDKEKEKQPDGLTTNYVYAVPIQDYKNSNESGFSILDMWHVLVNYKRLIAVIIFTFLVVSVITALLITPVYRADVLLAPAAKDNNSNLGIPALASQFGGLASLAGISVGDGGDIETAIATLKSRKFISRFITDLNLKPILFEDKWDSVNGQWISEKQSMFSKIKGVLISPPENSLKKNLLSGEPSAEEAYNKFRRIIFNVSQDKMTQLVTVSVEWKNSKQAAEWANALVKRLNEQLRQKTIDEAERSIDYLKQQISQTSLSELQNVLYRLIEEHTKIITLAKVNDEYVMAVIDPAVPPETRSKPNRKLIVSLGFAFGVIFGLFFAFIFNAVRNWREAEMKEE